MISTRSLYNPDLEFFRRNDRGAHMPLGQTSHIHEQYEVGGHLSSRTTPTSEPENRAASGSRKRVPVACERCRKRKIKCSGNEGDSQSCANCKNSGLEDSCRFLRVSSVDPSQYGLRSWHGPGRYAPYALPAHHHRLNYASLPPRCSPQPGLQYSGMPSSVDYDTYPSHTSSVDWRSPFVGPYSPYPDDEELSPYSSQPPPYILPNTDPMSATSSYYIHGQGVRPNPGPLWTEPQHCLPVQAGPQMSTVSSYSGTMPVEAPQMFQTVGSTPNILSERILPNPVSTRSYVPVPTNSLDKISISAPSNQRTYGFWPGDSATTVVQQMPTPVEPSSATEQHDERGGSAVCKVQETSYGQQIQIEDGLSATNLHPGTPLAVNELQPSGEVQPTHSSFDGVASRDSLKSTPESPSMAYGYKGSAGSRRPQLMSSSGQLSSSQAFCPSMYPRREPTSGDCVSDYSSCRTTDSTRTSVTSISNTSSGY